MRQGALQRSKLKTVPVIMLDHKTDEAIAKSANAVIKDNGIFAVDDAHNLILYAVPREFHILMFIHHRRRARFLV